MKNLETSEILKIFKGAANSTTTVVKSYTNQIFRIIFENV